MKHSKTRNAATTARKTELLDDAQPFAYKEAYKALRTNFNFATLDGKIKTIVVTSSIPGEGKTTFSINLAITLAEAGKKVLLIDADLRNPSIHRYLRLRQQDLSGLSNLLSSNMEASDVLGHLERYGLDLLLSGTIPPNPVELLDSDRVKEIIDELADEYDYIICDTPPASVVTDASVLSKHCDGIIMVVGQGKTKEEVAHRALESLKQSGTKIIGAVLNDYDARKDSKNTMQENAYYYAYGESK